LCLTVAVAVILGFALTSCRRSGGISIISPLDETADAALIVVDANKDLTKIKVLYQQNEGKREDLKAAMEKNDVESAKKIADEVLYLINDGTAFGKAAVEKIQKAQEMQINDDYREYLRLKEEALKRQLEAFENYRQAARLLRDSYDPKDVKMREKVKEEFKTRSENYRKLMEDARDYSSRANELAKDVIRRQQDN
jgi:tetratricopeptide (TPR) repeat protein